MVSTTQIVSKRELVSNLPDLTIHAVQMLKLYGMTKKISEKYGKHQVSMKVRNDKMNYLTFFSGLYQTSEKVKKSQSITVGIKFR